MQEDADIQVRWEDVSTRSPGCPSNVIHSFEMSLPHQALQKSQLPKNFFSLYKLKHPLEIMHDHAVNP